MTRDEAHDELPRVNSYMQWGVIHDVIDKIYDDFEKITCRTCKYCDTRDMPMVCMQMDVPTSYADVPDEKYSCNNWEAKI